MDTEMVREFFYAVSYSAAMNLHIKVLTPGNNHHMIEAMFLSLIHIYSYLSSTIVKEFASYGGDISKFVPEKFIDRIYAKYNITR